MDSNLKYIQENFIESHDLCIRTAISTQKLTELIQSKSIPAASYKITSTHSISSPLGDETTITEEKQYFPKNNIQLIKNAVNKQETPESLKEKLKNEFINTLVNHPHKTVAYDGITTKKGAIDMQKLNLIFEEEWQHYCNGIYGICTLNATGSEIAKKEIAVKKLIEFQKNTNSNQSKSEIESTLISLNNQFNEIANKFAPYQRASSSRGKYLDKALKLHNLSDKIQHYK
ncbi:MAG: hypothetical protein COB60_10070 [Flavobacteriaceae bacterium]|nr:MAG: hypothetical protein COB60_10070 [Flavobacteriaceae bacterium]